MVINYNFLLSIKIIIELKIIILLLFPKLINFNDNNNNFYSFELALAALKSAGSILVKSMTRSFMGRYSLQVYYPPITYNNYNKDSTDLHDIPASFSNF